MIIIYTIIIISYSQRTCQQQCLGQVQFNLCIQQCANRRTSIGILVGSIVGGILSLALLIYIIVVCLRSKQCQIFRQKNRRNNVDTNMMSQKQFYLHRKYFQNLLQDTLQRNTFQFTTYEADQNFQQSQKVQVIQYRLSQQNQFIFKFKLLAQDQIGQWIGDGYYFVSKQGIQIWWMKYYQQSDEYKHLQHQHVIFQGKMTRDKVYEGNWHFRGFQDDPKFSGKWSIYKRGTKFDNHMYHVNQNQSKQYIKENEGQSISEIKIIRPTKK